MSILKIDLQRTTFFLKCYFRIWAKIDFIRVISQQRNFPRNFHIFEHKDKKLFFQGDQNKSTFTLYSDIFDVKGKKDIFKEISKKLWYLYGIFGIRKTIFFWKC